MKTSIFTKGSARPPMGTVKEVDTTIPRVLWDITKGFRRTPTSLANIYNNKVKVNQIAQRITSEADALRESIKKVESEYARRIDDHVSGIKYTKEVKEQEFRHRRNMIKKERESNLNETIQSLKDYESEKKFEFEKEYKQGLETYKKLLNQAESLLKGNKMGLSDRSRKPKIDYSNETSDELKEILNYLGEEIRMLKEDGMVIGKLWDKVRDLDEKETATAGVITAISTVFFTPVVAAGAAATAAVSYKKEKESRLLIEELGVEISSIWRICRKRYEDIKNNNVLNLDEIQEEFQFRYKAIEDQHRMSIEDLEEDERRWEQEYKELQESDRVQVLQREMRQKIEEMTRKHKVQQQSQLQMQKDEELRFKKSKEEFEKKNKVPDMMSSFDSEIYKEIKALKDTLQGYIKFRNLDKLSYSLDYKGLEQDMIDKSTYDKLLYKEEYLPLKNSIEANNKKGHTEEYFKKQLEDLLRKEDSLFLLDTNKLHLGELIQEPKYESLGHIEQVLAGNFNNGSILMVYENQEEEKMMINYIKYLLQQMIAQMHPNALQINILNPSMDTSFNDIVIDTQPEDKTQPKQAYVDTYIGQDINELKESIQRQIRERQYGDLRGGGTISDVIKEKRKMQSKTPKFYVNVLHRMDPQDELMLINENSNVLGIINICLLDKKDIIDAPKDKEPKMDKGTKDILSRNNILITVNDITSSGEVIFSIFDKISESYKQVKYFPINKSLIDVRRKFYTERYHKSLKNLVTTLVDEYIMQVVGDNLWSKSAETTLELHFGYVDGDKSRPEPVVLDEIALAHGFVGGTTGGGKSVTLATVVNVMKAMYPPSELEVIYYDFKQVEVALHAKPYKWSNASALAGSSTAEYFVSLLQEMADQMDKRYADMKDAGVNKLSSYRKYLRKVKQELIDKGEYEKAALVEIPPRMVVIMDEVQEGFSIDSDTTEMLRVTLKKLSKVARAAGMHLILLTQNPDGVIPSDIISLFTMRGSTKASPDVSKSILGNDFASRPENQFLGFFAVNTSPKGDEEFNIRYSVPFTPEPLSQLYSKISADLAEKSKVERSRDAVVYDDDDIVSYEMLEKTLTQFPVKPYEIVVGDMVKYQKVYQPATIVLEPDQGQNIAFVSSERQSKVDFFNTITKSINTAGSKSIVLFGKGYEDEYEVDKNIKHHLLSKSIYVHNETGEVISSSEDIGNLNVEEIEGGVYREETVPRKHYDVTDYLPRPRYGSDEDDESMVGIMTTIYGGLIQKQINDRKETGKYEPVYIIVIDPERDRYILPDRLWIGPEYTSLVNEACSVGIFTITITSNLSAFGYRPWNRYVIGKNIGPDALYEKEFKNINPKLGRVRNMVNPTDGYTFKPPQKSGVNKKPWEI